MIDSFIPMYNAADTEIRKTDVRFQRKHAIASYFSGAGSLQFEGWVGEVKSLTTESDGEAYVSVQLPGTDIEIKTWNNSLSDTEDHTMIRRNDALYTSLRDIKEGDNVTVAGSFVEADQDYIREASLTEEGSMTGPEFIVRFSQISKGVWPLEKTDAAQTVTPAVSSTAPEESPAPNSAVQSASETQPTQPDTSAQPVTPAVSPSPVIGTAKVDCSTGLHGLQLYSGPQSSDSVLESLACDTEVSVLSGPDKNNWFQVQTKSNTVGYVWMFLKMSRP